MQVISNESTVLGGSAFAGVLGPQNNVSTESHRFALPAASGRELFLREIYDARWDDDQVPSPRAYVRIST